MKSRIYRSTETQGDAHQDWAKCRFPELTFIASIPPYFVTENMKSLQIKSHLLMVLKGDTSKTIQIHSRLKLHSGWTTWTEANGCHLHMCESDSHGHSLIRLRILKLLLTGLFSLQPCIVGRLSYPVNSIFNIQSDKAILSTIIALQISFIKIRFWSKCNPENISNKSAIKHKTFTTDLTWGWNLTSFPNTSDM